MVLQIFCFLERFLSITVSSKTWPGLMSLPICRVYRTFIAVFLCAVLPLSITATVYAGSSAQGKEQEQTEGQALLKQEESLEPSMPIPQLPSVSLPDKNYRLGPEDVLRITVYGEPELTQTYRVGSGGALSFPLIGEVPVAGRSVAEVESLIIARLSEGYLVNPSVAVQVETHRPFYILGEVRTPGSYAYVADMSIMNAVALAGGFTYRANRNTVEVMRQGPEGQSVTAEIPVETKVTPGDIILVKERFF